MRKYRVGAIVAAVLASVAVGGASSANAEPDGCIYRVNPGAAPVGLTPTVVGFQVSSTGYTCQQDDTWRLRIGPLGVDTTTEAPIAVFDPDYLTNHDTAPASINLVMIQPSGHVDGQYVLPYGFHLTRATLWSSFHATALSADRRTVRLTATLRMANWSAGVWQPYGRRTVLVNDYPGQRLVQAKTDAHGRINVTVRGPANSNNDWTLSYGGTGTAGPSQTKVISIRST